MLARAADAIPGLRSERKSTDTRKGVIPLPGMQSCRAEYYVLGRNSIRVTEQYPAAIVYLFEFDIPPSSGYWILRRALEELGVLSDEVIKDAEMCRRLGQSGALRLNMEEALHARFRDALSTPRSPARADLWNIPISIKLSATLPGRFCLNSELGYEQLGQCVILRAPLSLVGPAIDKLTSDR